MPPKELRWRYVCGSRGIHIDYVSPYKVTPNFDGPLLRESRQFKWAMAHMHGSFVTAEYEQKNPSKEHRCRSHSLNTKTALSKNLPRSPYS